MLLQMLNEKREWENYKRKKKKGEEGEEGEEIEWERERAKMAWKHEGDRFRSESGENRNIYDKRGKWDYKNNEKELDQRVELIETNINTVETGMKRDIQDIKEKMSMI